MIQTPPTKLLQICSLLTFYQIYFVLDSEAYSGFAIANNNMVIDFW